MSPESPPSDGPRNLRSIEGRRRKDFAFVVVCVTATALAMLTLAALLGSILVKGLPNLSWAFVRSMSSAQPEDSGILAALLGSVFCCLICAVTAIPLGVGTAVLLEEFKPRNRWALRLHGIVQTNITNLAGVPSIVYGILGLTVFGMMFGQFGVAGQSRWAVGQSWYLQYEGADRQAYFVRVEKDRALAWREEDSTDFPLADDALAYTVKEFNEAGRPTGRYLPARPTLTSEEEAAPKLSAIRRSLRTFKREFRDGLTAVRSGDRSNGPASIPDRAAAEAIVDAALASVELTADVDAVRDALVTQVLALDGADSDVLMEGRRGIEKTIADMEYAARSEGELMRGAAPVLVSEEAWYYLSLPFGRSILAGGLTLMLVILPVIIVASQEALRAVPDSMRQGALALGGTKWQSVSKIALPSAIPGICTGGILAMSRAIGEAAPLLILAGVVFTTSTPRHLMDSFTVLPLQIYNWVGKPQEAWSDLAASGIIVLLAVLFTFNALAVFIRQKTQKSY